MCLPTVISFPYKKLLINMSEQWFEFCTKDQLYDFFAEFNATEESVRNDVEYLKEWLRKQPHLPNIDDDDLLINFLLRCKNSIEKTKRHLDEYYTVRAKMPEVFQDRDPYSKEVEQVFQEGIYVPCPKLTPEGYRVVMFRIFADLRNCSSDCDNVIKATQLLNDYSLKKDKYRGLITIVDFEGITMNYITIMLSSLKKQILLGTKATPNRYHKIIILNLTPIAEPVITLGKNLIKKELADRIEIWKEDPKNLVKVLPKEVLPINYGGTEKSLEELRDRWYNEIKSFRDWFISDEKNKAILNKRPTDCSYEVNGDPSYGLDGSFRKICID